MKISRFIELYKNFGGDIAFSALAASRFWKMNYVKHRKILNYLENKYADFIKNYKPQKPLSVLSKAEFKNYIWTLWWQTDNYEEFPDVVKISHNSIRKFSTAASGAPAHEFRVLTQKNFCFYAMLPKHILEKFQAGKITITHLSDII